MLLTQLWKTLTDLYDSDTVWIVCFTGQNPPSLRITWYLVSVWQKRFQHKTNMLHNCWRWFWKRDLWCRWVVFLFLISRNLTEETFLQNFSLSLTYGVNAKQPAVWKCSTEMMTPRCSCSTGTQTYSYLCSLLTGEEASGCITDRTTWNVHT